MKKILFIVLPLLLFSCKDVKDKINEIPDPFNGSDKIVDIDTLVHNQKPLKTDTLNFEKLKAKNVFDKVLALTLKRDYSKDSIEITFCRLDFYLKNKIVQSFPVMVYTSSEVGDWSLYEDLFPDEKRKERMQMLGVNTYDKFYYAKSQGYLNQYMRNTLQLNNGQGKFSEIGQMAGIYKTSWSWAPLFADFDNDGYQDLFITNGFGKDVTDLDFVKFRTDISAYTSTNDKKEGSDKEISKALNKQHGIKAHPYLYRNRQDNTFEDMSEKWGFMEPVYSNGAAYVDLDNDGDLDIVTNNIDAPAHIYKNKSNDGGKTGTNNYLRVQLTGPAKNTFAAGSTVNINYDGKTQVRYLSPVRGFESTVEQVLHFGLGKINLVDSIEITWPDGKRTLQKKQFV